ncbi:hypothetical protein T06_15363 [Trichinella sp. T6]|nr:hypothetical protein T06_1157 [Trichinella sp. T6]KRX51874.1 hypothetical protein T06_15363 [Trichinella sp. T6]
MTPQDIDIIETKQSQIANAFAIMQSLVASSILSLVSVVEDTKKA